MGSKILTAVFDERTRRLSTPQEVKLPAGAARGAFVGFRPAGLVFAAGEKRSAVWLMKLPR